MQMNRREGYVLFDDQVRAKPTRMNLGSASQSDAAGNPDVCPASPQLSSQTLGSVSSITNSPMDLQGVNKSNSINNA